MEVEDKFVSFLLDSNICLKEDIDKAKEVQKKYHSKISTILLNLGVITEKKLLDALATFLGIEQLNSEHISRIRKVDINSVSFNFFEENGVYPLYEENGTVYLGLDINVNFSHVFTLSNILKKDINTFLISSEEIMKIKEMYSSEEGIDEVLDLDEDEEIEKLKELASEAPVIKMINAHFNKAAEQKASDIHYEAFKNGMYVRIRVDGLLHNIEIIPQTYKKAVIARLKLLSKMNISENRLPQDGRMSIKISNQEIDIRASSVPTAFGESFVLRLLGKQAISYSLNALEFYDDHLETLRTIASMPNGVFLTTGPTGSGKTTTLYSLLNELNSDKVKIITVEDPVEYELNGISQIQVKPQIGFNFANALRSILRQDPDIIMVGEIRDEETARISIQSSLTGHTVLSTLHTNSALGAITRLIDMNIEYFLLKSSINGLMAQRLVRKLCDSCKQEYQIDEELKRTLNVKSLNERYPFIVNRTYKAVGCDKCNNSGYVGRIPVAEIVVFDDIVQKAMQNDKNFNNLSSLGYRTLQEDATLKFLDGKTTYEEIIKV